jgi:pimeloyl-ACP methyl ester carboxylesterase
MGIITTKDGTEIYYKDWGKGQPIVFSHGWPLSTDDWDTQMLLFLKHGYLAVGVAHNVTACNLFCGPKWREAASLRQLLIGSRRATTHERLNLRRRQLSVFVGIHRLEDFGMSGLEFLKR